MIQRSKTCNGGNIIPGNKLTIKLTGDQKSQIKTATRKSISELNIDRSATGNLTGKDLDKVSFGYIHLTGIKSDDWTV